MSTDRTDTKRSATPDARVEEVTLRLCDKCRKPIRYFGVGSPCPYACSGRLEEVTAYIPPKGVRLVGLTDNEIEHIRGAFVTDFSEWQASPTKTKVEHARAIKSADDKLRSALSKTEEGERA